MVDVVSESAEEAEAAEARTKAAVQLQILEEAWARLDPAEAGAREVDTALYYMTLRPDKAAREAAAAAAKARPPPEAPAYPGSIFHGVLRPREPDEKVATFRLRVMEYEALLLNKKAEAAAERLLTAAAAVGGDGPVPMREEATALEEAVGERAVRVLQQKAAARGRAKDYPAEDLVEYVKGAAAIRQKAIKSVTREEVSGAMKEGTPDEPEPTVAALKALLQEHKDTLLGETKAMLNTKIRLRSVARRLDLCHFYGRAKVAKGRERVGAEAGFGVLTSSLRIFSLTHMKKAKGADAGAARVPWISCFFVDDLDSRCYIPAVYAGLPAEKRREAEEGHWLTPKRFEKLDDDVQELLLNPKTMAEVRLWAYTYKCLKEVEQSGNIMQIQLLQTLQDFAPYIVPLGSEADREGRQLDMLVKTAKDLEQRAADRTAVAEAAAEASISSNGKHLYAILLLAIMGIKIAQLVSNQAILAREASNVAQEAGLTKEVVNSLWWSTMGQTMPFFRYVQELRDLELPPAVVGNLNAGIDVVNVFLPAGSGGDGTMCDGDASDCHGRAPPPTASPPPFPPTASPPPFPPTASPTPPPPTASPPPPTPSPTPVAGRRAPEPPASAVSVAAPLEGSHFRRGSEHSPPPTPSPTPVAGHRASQPPASAAPGLIPYVQGRPLEDLLSGVGRASLSHSLEHLATMDGGLGCSELLNTPRGLELCAAIQVGLGQKQLPKEVEGAMSGMKPIFGRAYYGQGSTRQLERTLGTLPPEAVPVKTAPRGTDPHVARTTHTLLAEFDATSGSHIPLGVRGMTSAEIQENARKEALALEQASWWQWAYNKLEKTGEALGSMRDSARDSLTSGFHRVWGTATHHPQYEQPPAPAPKTLAETKAYSRFLERKVDDLVLGTVKAGHAIVGAETGATESETPQQRKAREAREQEKQFKARLKMAALGRFGGRARTGTRTLMGIWDFGSSGSFGPYTAYMSTVASKFFLGALHGALQAVGLHEYAGQVEDISTDTATTEDQIVRHTRLLTGLSMVFSDTQYSFLAATAVAGSVLAAGRMKGAAHAERNALFCWFLLMGVNAYFNFTDFVNMRTSNGGRQRAGHSSSRRGGTHSRRRKGARHSRSRRH